MTTGEERRQSVIHAFKKYGIWIALDGSENHKINIKGLTDREKGYIIGDWHTNPNLTTEARPISEIMEDDIIDADESVSSFTFITEDEHVGDEIVQTHQEETYFSQYFDADNISVLNRM